MRWLSVAVILFSKGVRQKEGESFAVVHTLHSLAHRSEYLVGYGVEDRSKFIGRQIGPEDLHAIAGPTFREIGDIDHAAVHADVANGWAAATADHHAHGPTAEVAREAVGISHRECGDAARAVAHTIAAIANGCPLGPFVDRYDGGVEGAHGAQAVLTAIVHGADAIKAYAKTHKVVLMVGEAHYAGGVEDVAAYDKFGEQSAQLFGCGVEIVKLPVGIIVFRGIVGHGQM